MDYSNLGIFGALKAKLDYASERQSVLAQNVANVDTPGYRAKDIAQPDFAKMAQAAQNLPMTVTSPGHIAQTPMSMTPFKITDRTSTYDQNPDGNNVSVEEEMMKISDNQGEYQKSLNLYQKMVAMFNTAVGNQNSGS